MFRELWNRLTKKTTFEPKGIIEDKDAYVHKAYEAAINYYRKTAKSTKRNYKTYRLLTTVLGALVTLISSLAATKYIEQWPDWAQTSIVLATPIIAAILTVTTGLSQSFQWGSTWREMSVHAQKIIAARDIFLATPPAQRDHIQELSTLNSLLIAETESFFQRILDSQMSAAVASQKKEDARTESESVPAAGIA